MTLAIAMAASESTFLGSFGSRELQRKSSHSALVMGLGILILIILIISYTQFKSIPVEFQKSIRQTKEDQATEPLTMLDLFY